MKRLIAFLLLLDIFAGTIAMAQTATDSIKIYFWPGYSRFDPEMNSNSGAMRHFMEEIRNQAVIGNIERLLVRSYTSPDGVSTANELLSENRCFAVASHIATETGADMALIDIDPEGIAWDELRRMVAADNRVPLKNEVLRIIDNTPVWVYGAGHKITGSRKKSLMELQGGDVYRWLRRYIFPKLNIAVVYLYLKNDSFSNKNLSTVEPTMKTKPEIDNRTLGITSSAPITTKSITHTIDIGRFRNITFHRFALKTNVLYAAIIMPALELEWRMSKNWSVNLEGNMAWWKKKTAHKCYQMAIVSPEVRRMWPRGKRHRNNIYVGLFAGAGLYDLEDGTKGYRGEGVMAGLSFGYSWSLSKRLSLETGIGLGWMTTQYKEYTPYENHHIYTRSRSTNYFGPLKLKLAFAWHFGSVVRYRAKEDKA